jgi:hypothetical protein
LRASEWGRKRRKKAAGMKERKKRNHKMPQKLKASLTYL